MRSVRKALAVAAAVAGLLPTAPAHAATDAYADLRPVGSSSQVTASMYVNDHGTVQAIGTGSGFVPGSVYISTLVPRANGAGDLPSECYADAPPPQCALVVGAWLPVDSEVRHLEPLPDSGARPYAGQLSDYATASVRSLCQPPVSTAYGAVGDPACMVSWWWDVIPSVILSCPPLCPPVEERARGALIVLPGTH